MMKPTTLASLVLSLALVLAFGCSKEDDQADATSISIMAEVGRIAPQLASEDDDGAGAFPPNGGDFPTDGAVSFVDDPPDSVLNVIEQFLRFTCHNADGTYNVCAEYGIEVEDDYSTSPYAGSSDNFMSMVSAFGAQFDEVFMHPEEVAACDRFEGTAKTPEFTGSTEFLLGASGGFVAALDCIASTQYSEQAAETHFAYSADPRSAAFLTAGLEDPGRGSYIYQGFARRDEAGQSKVVAMNSPVLNLNGSSERLLFVGNLENNRIALKWIGFGAGATTHKAVYAIGVAGITAEGPVAGYYGLFAEAENDDGLPVETVAICVDNGTRSIVAAVDAPERCSDPIITAWLDGASTWDDVVAYLGLTEEDRAVIDDEWGALLGTGAAFTADHVPWDESELIAAIE